jgi:hypothetical protein
MPAMNTGGPADVAGEAVRRERVAEPARRDAAVQHGEVGGMEDRVSRSREQRREDQRGISRREPEDDGGERQEREARPEHALRSEAIDRESRQRLAHAGDDEEGGGERAGAGEAHAELGHQPGEQRGDDQVEEVRRRVGEADQRHDPEVDCAGRRRGSFHLERHSTHAGILTSPPSLLRTGA